MFSRSTQKTCIAIKNFKIRLEYKMSGRSIKAKSDAIVYADEFYTSQAWLCNRRQWWIIRALYEKITCDQTII